MLVDVIRLAPADCVQIAVTTRFDGHISGRFGFNLATHVNDQPEAVAANREVLVEFLGLSRQPVWLDQYHSAEIVEVNHNTADVPRADGSFTAERGLPLAILTAAVCRSCSGVESSLRVTLVGAGSRQASSKRV